MTSPLATLWTEPVVVVVVDVGRIFTGLGAVIPRVSTITTNFTRQVRVHGLDRNEHLLFVPFVEFLQLVVHFGGEHIRLLDGMHSAFGSELGTLLVPALVGDHLLDQGFGIGDGEIEIGPSSSSVQVGS